MCVSVRRCRQVDPHDRLKLGLVAAVFKGRVVMVTAEHVRLIIRKTGTVKSKVIALLVVGVRFTHPKVC